LACNVASIQRLARETDAEIDAAAEAAGADVTGGGEVVIITRSGIGQGGIGAFSQRAHADTMTLIAGSARHVGAVEVWWDERDGILGGHKSAPSFA